MMKNVRIVWFSLAVAAGALSVVGCSGATATEQPQTSASAATKAPVGANTHGVVKLVGEALGEVSLRPDQRVELEKLATEVEARHMAMADGRKDLMRSLADQIEAGSLDKAALQPKIDRVVADLQKSQPDDQAALVRVHALLDSDQRNAFVDALEARMKGGKGKHGGFANHEGFARMRQLADDLKLTDDQRAQIRDIMKEERGKGGGPDFRAMGERFHAGKRSLESFRTDKFEPMALAGKQVDLRDKVQDGTTRMVGVAEKILPILTPDQRKIAADKLRDFAARGGPAPLGN
jgi:Spy/CpxP family protein refolding chaperone